ncbi:putative unknown lipoprotein [Flavobacteriales bacterium ALC-1]|nr:putative unknown lipoprotein [Flavobacteriales bacterium ALC-1]
MKTIKILFLFICAVLITGCSSDNDNNTAQNNAPVLNDIILEVSENPNSDLVTTIVATDSDEDTLTYAIISQTPAGSVSINAINGEVYIANADAFDYDLNQQIIVTIEISDGITEVTAQLTINITQDS